jgi:hypothetical protein
MRLLLLLLFFNYHLSCLAKIDGSAEDGKSNRFLRPDEIQGQVLPKMFSKPSTLTVTTSGPNVFNAQKYTKSNRKSGNILPLISLVPSPLVQLPIGQHTATRLETSFSLEASVPILASEQREQEPIDEEPPRTTASTSTTTRIPEELDEQEEHEVSS